MARNVTPFPRTRPSWWGLLQLTDKNKPLANAFNCMVVLSNEIGLKDAMAYDAMLHAPVLQHVIGFPLDSNGYPQPMTEDHVHQVQIWMQDHGLRTMGYKEVERGMFDHSRQNIYHPIRDYLEQVAWDQEQRLDIWLAKYLGVPSTPYASAIGKMFLISMVARILEPGCKADYMLVLEGPQGELKSSALRTLGGEWFSDSLPDIDRNAKDASQHLRGKWLCEIPEMHAFNKADTLHLKSFLSRQEERFRPPFCRFDSFEPRQVLFAGTTNKDLYLKDETGGRRFWPVKCGTILLELLAADRDQLFAEAVVAYHAGEHWWPDRAFEKQFIIQEQQARYDADVWEELVGDFINGKTTPLTLKQFAIGCLGYEDPAAKSFLFGGDKPKTPLNRFGTAEQNRLKRALAAHGWERVGRQGGTGATLFGPRP